MTVKNIWDVMGALTMVALVTTIVAHPNTAADVRAAGDAFIGSLRAAQGR